MEELALIVSYICVKNIKMICFRGWFYSPKHFGGDGSTIADSTARGRHVVKHRAPRTAFICNSTLAFRMLFLRQLATIVGHICRGIASGHLGARMMVRYRLGHLTTALGVVTKVAAYMWRAKQTSDVSPAEGYLLIALFNLQTSKILAADSQIIGGIKFRIHRFLLI